MTHDILPSDVECAKAMLDSSHSDAEILAFLATRGIEPAKAGGLVDDLRHGRHPSVQLPFGLGRAALAQLPKHRLPQAMHLQSRARRRGGPTGGTGDPVIRVVCGRGDYLPTGPGVCYFRGVDYGHQNGVQEDTHEVTVRPGK